MTSEPLLYKDKGPKYHVNLQIAVMFVAIFIFYQTFTVDSTFYTEYSLSAWPYYLKTLAYISLLIPAGGLATNWSAKKLLCLSIAGIGVVHLLGAILRGTIHQFNYQLKVICIVLMNILIGATQAPVLPCVYALLARLASPERRATVYSAVFSAKHFIAALTFILLRRSTYSADSVITRVILGLIAVFWSIGYHYLGSNCDLEFVDQAPSFKPKIPWRSILSSLPVWTLILSHAANVGGQMITIDRYVTVLNVLNAEIMLTIVFLILVLGGIGSGYLSDSLVLRHRLTRLKARKIFNSLSTFVPGAVFVVAYAIEHAVRGGYLLNSVIWALMQFIIVLLISFQGSGFVINHMDLSPYYAGILIAITEMADQVTQAVVNLIVLNLDSVAFGIMWSSVAFFIVTGIFFAICSKTSIQDKWSPVPVSYQEQNKLDKVTDLL